MALTIASGLTNVTLANNNTGFGVWKRDGTGGSPTAVSETDVFIQGTGACSVKVSNQGIVLAYATGGLNLSAANTHVYIWANMLAGGLMANRSANGLCIFISSDATLSSGANYSMWAVDGADTYPGGWVRYVIDVSKTRTTGAGTLNLASVQHIGMYCDTRPNVAKFDNLVIDRIDYTTGTGLRAYGTATTDAGFGDMLAADEGTVGNKYGILTSKNGIIYVRGRILLGDNVGTNATTFTSTNRVLVFEEPQYYNGSSVVPCMASALCGISLVGNGTGSTDIQFGKKVGTGDDATGRNGVTMISSHAGAFFNMNNANLTSVKLYGSSWRDFSGTMIGTTNTTASSNFEFMGNTVDNCSQFVPSGAITIRNCIFSNHAGTNAALLWNANIDIKNCRFIANTHGTNNPAGIEHTVAGSVNYIGLLFSGNDNDVFNNAPYVNCDSYATGNQSTTYQMYNAIRPALGQAFNGNGGKLSKAEFFMRKSGSPTGNAYFKLYAISGTYGTSAVPTGAPLATSEAFDVSTLSTVLGSFGAYFKDQVTLVNGTKYMIVLEYTGGDAANYLVVGADNTSPTHGGNLASYNGSVWSAVSTADVCFGIYVDSVLIVNASGGANPSVFRNGTLAFTFLNNTISITLTGLKTNTEIRVYNDSSGDNGDEVDGVENSGTSFSFSASASDVVNIMINHLSYLPADIWQYTIPASDTSIPISQVADRQYLNP